MTSPLSSGIRIAISDPNKDLMAVAQLVSDIFAKGQYVQEIAQTYIGNCHYDWNTTCLAWDGEKLVHHWGVWGYSMRLESTTLKVAGIGAVGTHPDYRKSGLMHQAALVSFDAMKREGYDLSILRGRHYVKMGYARAWNYVTYFLKPEEIPDLEAVPTYQRLNADRLSEMDTLYNQAYAPYTGTAVRPTYRNRPMEEMGIYAWEQGNGQLAGYVRAVPSEENPKILQCLEAVGDPEQCLAVLGDLFKRETYEKLAFFTLPHLHPMLQRLRRGGCIVEDRYFDISGWRVKIINLHSTLEKLLPLFEKRLAESQFSDWQGSLILDAGEQQAALRMEKGKVRMTGSLLVEHRIGGGQELARFLIGSDEPDEIIRQGNMACSGLALPLVRVLFPNLHPMLSHWDEF